MKDVDASSIEEDNASSIRGIIDHLHGNNSFLELELGCVPNGTICSTNSTVELVTELLERSCKNWSRAVPNMPIMYKTVQASNF